MLRHGAAAMHRPDGHLSAVRSARDRSFAGCCSPSPGSPSSPSWPSAAPGSSPSWSHPPGTPARAELTWHGDQAVERRARRRRRRTSQAHRRRGRPAVRSLPAAPSPRSPPTTRSRSARPSSEGGDTAPAPSPPHRPPSGRTSLAGCPATWRTDQTQLWQRRPGPAGGDADRARCRPRGSPDSWASLTVGSLAASDLISLLTSHDVTVAAAAREGREAEYPAALATLAVAVTKLDDAADIRDRLENTTDVDDARRVDLAEPALRRGARRPVQRPARLGRRRQRRGPRCLPRGGRGPGDPAAGHPRPRRDRGRDRTRRPQPGRHRDRGGARPPQAGPRGAHPRRGWHLLR